MFVKKEKGAPAEKVENINTLAYLTGNTTTVSSSSTLSNQSQDRIRTDLSRMDTESESSADESTHLLNSGFTSK